MYTCDHWCFNDEVFYREIFRLLNLVIKWGDSGYETCISMTNKISSDDDKLCTSGFNTKFVSDRECSFGF